MTKAKLTVILAVTYVGLVILANWLASKYVWTVPFTGGLMAPGGVFAIGAVLVMRDWIQQLRGLFYALPLMLLAGATSYLAGIIFGWTSLQKIALASVAAFLVSETVEAVIFTPIRNRSLSFGVALRSHRRQRDRLLALSQPRLRLARLLLGPVLGQNRDDRARRRADAVPASACCR